MTDGNRVKPGENQVLDKPARKEAKRRKKEANRLKKKDEKAQARGTPPERQPLSKKA